MMTSVFVYEAGFSLHDNKSSLRKFSIAQLIKSTKEMRGTDTTVQQAMALFFQRTVRQRCVPSPTNPGTDLSAVIQAGGTIYLLGRDDPYASASPLMSMMRRSSLQQCKSLGEHSETIQGPFVDHNHGLHRQC